MKRYTRSSRDLNVHLISKAHGRASPLDDHSDDDEHTKSWKENKRSTVDDTDKGLHGLLNRSRAPHKLTVFHGMNMETSKTFSPGEAAKQHPQRHVTFPSYLSTSVNPDVSSAFARPAKGYAMNEKDNEASPHPTHMLRIHLPKGHKGFKYVGDNSDLAGEYEGIVNKNTTLKIGKTPTIVKHPSGGEMHVWDAKPVREPKAPKE